MEKFWLVMSANRPGLSTQHETAQAAVREAERLCREIGKSFFVLEAIAYCEAPEPLRWHALRRSAAGAARA